MQFSPEDREHIARILRRKKAYSEEEIQQMVDFCLQLAPELLKIWKKKAIPKNTIWQKE